MSKPNIDECPICGGNIQATIECWYSDLTLSADGQTVVSKGSLDSQDDGEIQVYCENDHTQAEMVEWIKTGKPIIGGDDDETTT